MQRLLTAAAIAALLAVGATSVQAAPGRDDHHRVAHKEWRRSAKIEQADWNRGRAVDWRSQHLSEPSRGYEWREVDGNWVLAEIATGVITSVMQAED